MLYSEDSPERTESLDATGDVRVAEAAGTDNESGSAGDVPASARYVQQGIHPERVTSESVHPKRVTVEPPSGTEDSSPPSLEEVVKAMEARGWTYIGTTEMGMPFFAQTPSAPSGPEGVSS